jgi:hypothetical protein
LPAVKPADICRIRLATQFLTTTGPASPSAVVRALGAVQSQDYPGAKWAVSQRGGFSDAEIERELAAGRIVRTHVLRPTWHFVAAEDIRWLLGLTGSRISARMSPYNGQLGLTPQIFRKANDALGKALGGGECLTRAELRPALERLGIGEVSGQRLAHVMMQAELDAIVCSGPVRGKRFTYGLLDTRAPRAITKTRDEALADLTRLYFATRGPATASDFGWWSGLLAVEIKRGLEMVGKELEHVTIGTRTYWMRPGAREAKARASAHLLPNYDEYFIGHKDRSAIGQRIGSAKLVTGGSALIGNVAIVDGQIVGGWKRSVKSSGVVVDITTLTRLKVAEKKRLARAAAALGKFLGSSAEVAYHSH